jgi:hypothetical protein
MPHILRTVKFLLVAFGDVRLNSGSGENIWSSAELPYLASWVSSGDKEVIREDGLAGDEKEEEGEYGTMKRRDRMWHELVRDMNWNSTGAQ